MCKSCELLRINGVVCHETGCPDAWKDEIRDCAWCGQPFKPEHSQSLCCSHSCIVAFHNLSCDCEECNLEVSQ
jgi:hypothetical protein